MTLPTSHPAQLAGHRSSLVEEIIAHDRHRLRTYEWHPRPPHDPARPRALVVLAYGYGEHANRHARPIAELVGSGYLVAALDHRGHGHSEGPRATCHRFDDFTEDFAALVHRTADRYPRAPLFALGYSMGSLVALRYALRPSEAPLAGLIVAGVALHPVPRISGPIRPVIKSLVRHVSRLAPNLPVTPPCEERCRPGADPLCYAGPTPARMASELLVAADDALERLQDLTCPLLVLHGARDRITGPQGAVQLHENAASRDKTLNVFDHLKHPVLTPKTSGAPARAALMRWLDHRTPRPADHHLPTERIAA